MHRPLSRSLRVCRTLQSELLIHSALFWSFFLSPLATFCSLLLRRECCSFSNGEFVKEGLAELELWAGEASEEFTGNALDELRFIRQAVGFLVGGARREEGDGGGDGRRRGEEILV